MTDKKFPIQPDYDEKFREVDWKIAEVAYKEYKAQYGNSQSLERIVERGGFSINELVNLLYDGIVRITKKGTSEQVFSFNLPKSMFREDKEDDQC